MYVLVVRIGGEIEEGGEGSTTMEEAIKTIRFAYILYKREHNVTE